MKNTRFICILIIPLFAIIDLLRPPEKARLQQKNQPPVVKLIAPKSNSTFDWDATVNYEISVADKEDGDSKYDEINTKEVLLEVRYLNNKSMLTAFSKPQNDSPGLAVIRTSNCFNCHSFNGKAIGPSFFDVSKRYTAAQSNIDTLIKRIKAGSSGIWGKESMPTHPELSDEQVKSAVQWILKYAANPDINYYIGTQGNFRTKPNIGTKAKKGYYLLTASYTDHGLKNSGNKRLKGQDVIVLSSR